LADALTSIPDVGSGLPTDHRRRYEIREEGHPMRRLRPVRLAAPTIAVGALVAAALMTSLPARAGAGGAQHLDALCIANIYSRGPGIPWMETLNVGVVTSQYPLYWDVTPPFGAWAYARGSAVVTPSGELNVNCNTSTGFLLETVGDAHWPIGKTTQKAPCFTALLPDQSPSNPMGYGAKTYGGEATVTIFNTGKAASQSSLYGDTTINCHMKYTGTYEPDDQ
jgi:hypothetical protein